MIDLMPTCLDLAGATYPTELEGRKPLPLDGRSLAPLFRGEKRKAHEFLAWLVPQHRVFRQGDWKIVSPVDGKSPWELYDLTHDGTETTDLAQRHPALVKELAAKWQAWIDSCE
jgi:arylsulfatase